MACRRTAFPLTAAPLVGDRFRGNPGVTKPRNGANRARFAPVNTGLGTGVAGCHGLEWGPTLPGCPLCLTPAEAPKSAISVRNADGGAGETIPVDDQPHA